MITTLSLPARKIIVLEKTYQKSNNKLGVFNDVTPSILADLEEFICILYGFPKLNSVNKVRKSIFNRIFQKEGKTINLSFISPCQANLQLYITPCNYVKNIYDVKTSNHGNINRWSNCKRANCLKIYLDSPKDHGWDDNGSLIKMIDMFSR
jgi:hypothetical protein